MADEFGFEIAAGKVSIEPSGACENAPRIARSIRFFTMPSSSIGTKGRLLKLRVGLLRVTEVDSLKPRTEGRSGSLSWVSVSPTERILETAKVSIR